MATATKTERAAKPTEPMTREFRELEVTVDAITFIRLMVLALEAVHAAEEKAARRTPRKKK